MNKTILILIYGIFLSSKLLSQDISDAERLSKLAYMKYAENITCDSINGSNLEHRVCLNLEFQEVDSILNVRFNSLINNIKNDSIRGEIRQFQSIWIINRRIQSELISNGFQGHILGVYYLDTMINITRRRIEELEYLIKR